MSPVGLSLGYFSPSAEFADLMGVAQTIREICGPVSAAYPYSRVYAEGPEGGTGLFYSVIEGAVPIHIEKLDAGMIGPTFTFVIWADERPVILFAPAGQREAGCILQPEESKVPSMGFGAVELWPGRAVHFDVARAFHGITSFPTGDPEPSLPRAVLVQVPRSHPRDVGGAVSRMREIMGHDPRFAGFIAKGGDDEIRLH